ncbi:MAG: DUF4271 domain-containing protein [Flaviramulus sp.]|nr:DUF4271 domain-containing protein [Flaviramulus sp.]NNC50807.1 DUF4271 domain-containing protein [Flaviramulus sp.]
MFRNIVSNELFTVLLVIGLAIIAIAKLTAPKRFDDFIVVLGKNKYLKIYSREQRFLDKFDGLLFINLVISLSVFCYIFYQISIEKFAVSVNDIFKLSVGIAAFILIKVLIERLVASLFEIDKLIDKYLFQKITYKNYLGILLLPINALLLFTLHPNLKLLYLIIALILIINIAGLISSYKTNLSVIKTNLFYFILYLCALEIAPYVILYKVFFVT